MKNIPPLTALRCFEAASRLGGVTLAARELHVTHSAVSQQIRILEDTLGIALFVREARGLRLTEEGRLYALEIRSALRDIANATLLARARPQESELVIATLPSFALYWLLPRLVNFRERHPYYRVRLQTSLEIQDVRHGLADVSIRMGQGHWPELAQKALFSDELLVVASPHFNGGKLPRSAEEIVSCPLIRSSDAPWTDWCQAANVREPVNAEGLSANDSNIVLGAVLLGQGIALERRTLVADAIARGELVQITDIHVPYPYPYWLVWQQREVLSVKQTHFMEWIGTEVKRYLDRAG
ncbi:LysR substrate-binding domain-containing protein [Caballeronia sp. SEWSISQ10-4 2]|uniref:LysR substrate-binding domain-containing protein n=1 Tax=Caballeronia sp. SEWSISQ10-4 2 TaxID=2937438 RepID=UPI002653696D|nr:LysR substrate-binding domain-containing protein [Caballeronia sp. SEWSISQ10-4 2]MDN7178691.1 LysR substrate-binding domain-containing protein [Caballeronia sp. SEWSISQ10-4 2]